jgi:hypothetical protein
VKRSVLSTRIDYFDLPTTDEFLAPPAESLVVQDGHFRNESNRRKKMRRSAGSNRTGVID